MNKGNDSIVSTPFGRLFRRIFGRPFGVPPTGPTKNPTKKPTKGRADNGVMNKGNDCWGGCRGRQGSCSWCGTGACCRQGWPGSPASCGSGTRGGPNNHQCAAADTTKPTSAWCGGHRAESCTRCPECNGRWCGQAWCNGECAWNNSASRCEPKNSEELLSIKGEGERKLSF